MAEFTGDSQSYKPFTFLDIDTNIELTNQFPELNPNGLENPNINLQSFIFSNDNFLVQQQPEFAMQFADNLPNLYYSNASNAAPIVQSMASAEDVVHERKKQKTMEVSESSSKNSSTPVSGNGSKEDNKRKNSLGRGKRGRSDEKNVEKPKEEVIHVRARRGQATDSHSLAERVRREKINERLRCLQDLVPGCYKTMGMAVMLDEIINYVQSLQNQVEFLSMKLSAASSAYEHNPEIEVMASMQGTNAYEAQEVERLIREGYGGFSYFPSTWPL